VVDDIGCCCCCCCCCDTWWWVCVEYRDEF
jgi:hypothetical protein